MDSTLDRATVENDTEDNKDQDRVLHSSEVFGQSASISPKHTSKRHQAKIKANHILPVNHSSTATSSSADGVTLSQSPDLSTKPGRLDHTPANEGLHGLRDFVQQPLQTTKAKAERATNRGVAKNVATAEISHAHDVELVMAQDRLNAANTEEDRSSASYDLERIKKARQDMFVRWTMDRHVLKLRQLESQPTTSRSRGEFNRRSDDGQVKTDWTAYGQHVRDVLSLYRFKAGKLTVLMDISWLIAFLKNMAANISVRSQTHLLLRGKQLVQASKSFLLHPRRGKES